MMRGLRLLPLLFFGLLFFSTCNAKSSDEANHLLKFIKSTRPSRSMHDDTWTRLNTRNDDHHPPMLVSSQFGLMAADKIDRLPGQPQGVNFDQYAGYVTVDSTKGRALFYYFVEASQDPGAKPLVLWLNGGPGCSSLAGAMLELGPFGVNSDGKTLYANEYSWNKVANIIFLESPAGVGFSYSNTSSDYNVTGDTSTANDAYTFLINWLERFPHYKSHDFFITGESYAGHYIPELASLILKNNAATNNTVIKLKGVAVGNAFVDANLNEKAIFDYLWTHAMISDESYKNIQSKCTFSTNGTTEDCVFSINATIEDLGNIDLYNIYAPICPGSSNATSSKKILVQPDPCFINYLEKYLNLAEVQKAFHANLHLPYPWSLCSNLVGGQKWHDAPATTLPIIQELIGSGLRVWLYSGDQDSIVPVTSTKYLINMLGLPIESKWRAWYTNGEVGGYVIGYKGLTFATVRGAGHQVPSYQPERALILFSSFLNRGF